MHYFEKNATRWLLFVFLSFTATTVFADTPPTKPLRILGSVPSFSLSDQHGDKANMADFIGHVWVANFIFTRCQNTCPLQTASMNKLNKNLDEYKHREGIRFVSVSVDPENDTPEVLTDYIAKRNLDTTQWSFLTGSREDIWELSKKGLRLPVSEESKDTKMPILHSSQFVLVDAQGRIRGYYNGLDKLDLNKLSQDLHTLSQELIPFPEDVMNPSWVKDRMETQLEASKEFEVFKGFNFNDETSGSGITFRHKIVDDAGASWKAAHYDHGNGIAVADVDQDGLYDIYFTTLIGSNELWRNIGNGKFENITASAGLLIDNGVGMSASFADIDNDGDPDLYITKVRVGNLLFENDGKGHFKDITNRSQTGIKAHSAGAVFFDYNRDGLLDLFVTNVGVYTSEQQGYASMYTETGQISSGSKYNFAFKDAFSGHLKPERSEASVLFKNLGNNTFKNVNKELNFSEAGWNGDATVIDGNNDGWPDLYIIDMQGHDQYYENVKGKQFIRKSRELFPKTSWGSMGVKSFDYDNDGDMDIFVTDMHSDMRDDLFGSGEELKSPQPYPTQFLASGGNELFGNAFYRNDGHGKYTEISDQIGAENFWPWGLSSGDLNADGFEDVFIPSSMNFPFRYAPNSLLLNNMGKGFLDSEYVLGVEPRKNNSTSAPWFEVYCSGADAQSSTCNGIKGPRVIWGALGSRSSVIFDLDADGDLDIVTLEFNQPPMVLISNLSEQKNINYLKINLVGTKSNKSGIGAIIKVFAGDDIYTKAHDGKSGYLSQSLLPVYFGLDDNRSVDKIEVTWPSGKKQKISKNIDLNTLMTINES
ncbi:MAG: cytochrome oxidase Cu insertion factor (SCO1/SenC/PrrC family) [Flavobacteriales bacterium]|jgi:cytochrome oxidase Cu insertion factor (SCO1/SenC/PrrC family)